MVHLDWSKVLQVTLEEITEQEKEEFYEKIAWCDLDEEIPVDHLRSLFRLSQEILKFKGDQVDFLVSELDNLAARQGEEEARKQQSEEENEDVKKSLRPSRDSSVEEIVKLELQNEQLLVDLQAREKELLEEKKEIEKVTGQIMILEQEKNELRRELSALQREIREKQGSKIRSGSPDQMTEKLNELTESVRQKNKHITQLLNDIEVLEKENKLLKEKLSSARSELENATHQMTKLAGDSSSLHHSVNEQQEQIEHLEEQNVALRRQVAELVAEKRRRDDQLDNLGIALDSRLVQWEEIMKKKDEELEDLKQQLLNYSASPPNLQLDVQTHQLALLTQAVEAREEQIDVLQMRLLQATEDLNKSSEILEEYKEKLKERMVREDVKKPSEVKILEQQIKEAEAKFTLLENKLKDAEEDAQSKAEEMSNMIIQLRDYESGEFGLSQAMEQIKELRKQKAVRDKHIEQLVQAGNQLQEEANQLEEENLALRERLGLDVDEVIRVDGVVARHKQDKDKIVELSEQVENAEDTQIQLKLENRELNKMIEELQTRLKDMGSETKIELILPSIPEKTDVSKDLEEVNSRLKEMIDENEALRKGMHEILDSVRHHDGSSIIRIESACLERLLEALDSRHVSGWYHPAMRLQAQLNLLYGINASLRDQLHVTRENEAELLVDLQKSTMQIEELEKQVSGVKDKQGVEIAREEFHEVDMSEEPNTPKGAIEFISKLKSRRKVTVDQLEKGEAANHPPTEVNQDVINFMEKVSALEELMKEADEKYDTDRESWIIVRTGLEEELERVRSNEFALKKQVSEFKEQLEALNLGPNELTKKIADNGLRLGNFANENAVLNRKIAMVLDMEGRTRSKCDSLTEELAMLETNSKETIGQLTRDKELLSSELKNIRSILQDTIPVTDFELVKQEMNELTIKHRETVKKIVTMEIFINQQQARIHEELSYWQNQCSHFQQELANEMEKNILASIKEPSSEILEISKKLTESEIREEADKLKFEHTERMYSLMKEQVAEIEDRCKQLEANNVSMVQQNLSSQLVEAELRNQLVNSVSHGQYSQLKSKLSDAEKQLAEMKLERSKLLEEVEIAEQRVKAIECIRKEHDFQHDALQRQILELSAVSDDKATIGRLTRELSMVYQHEIATNGTINKQQCKIQNLESINNQLQNQIKNLEEQNDSLHYSFVNKYRLLIDVIHYLHQRYLGSVPIITIDTMGAVIMYLREQMLKLRDSAFNEVSLSSEKIISQELNSEDDKSEKRIKATYQRLQELNRRIEVDALIYRVNHAENQAETQEKLCRDIQQELIALDTAWERKLLKWEEIQIELCKKIDESPQQDIEISHAVTEVLPSSPEPCTVPSSVTVNQQNQSSTEILKDEVKSVDTPPAVVEIPDLQLPAVSPHSDVVVEQQMAVITSLQDQLSQANNSLSQQSVKLTNCEKVCNDLRTQLAVINAKLEERNSNLSALKTQLSEKDTQLLDKENELVDLRGRQSNVAAFEQHHISDNTEVLALKATVASLQNIVNQKEETIGRYQTLLKECRDEHKTAVSKLQQEIDTLQQTVFEKQTQVSYREKDDSKEKSEHVRIVVQKYISKVHELEDELAQANDQISQLTKQLTDCKKYAERMKSYVVSQERQSIHLKKSESKEDQGEEKERDSEEEKADSCKESDDDNEEHRDLEQAYANLAVELKEKVKQIEKLNLTIAEMKRNRVDSTNRDRLRAELERKKKRLEMLETRCEEYKTEVDRLRHQLISRPSRPESVASAREEYLQKRVKTLEEQLADTQQREEKERESHRSKCAEEVERWQERKRWQNANDKLRSQIKTQSTQIEVLQATQHRLRDTVSRLERERNALENKLKAMKNSAVAQTLVDELEKEVRQLKSKNELLKKTTELTSGSASLTEVIESQQRKIEALQLAQQGESVLAEEVERLQDRKSQLQKLNLKLEGENLKLKMEIEKCKTHQNDSDITPESDNSDSINTKDTGSKKPKRSYADLERAVIVLRRVVEKLQAENKKLHNSQIHGLKDKNYVEKLQVELHKAQESYMDTLDKLSSLEAQLKQEKENYCMVQQQLMHKAKLLSNCKILLERAAIREKALSEQVSDLQNLVPPESLRGTYHETRR